MIDYIIKEIDFYPNGALTDTLRVSYVQVRSPRGKALPLQTNLAQIAVLQTARQQKGYF